MPESGMAGDAYGPLIEDQLNSERAAKSSFEQRAVAVITTSGVLVSLLFGLAAIVTSTEGFEAPYAARVLLAVALGFFLGAAVLGIAVNAPRGYEEAASDNLRLLTEQEFWEARQAIGSRRAAEVRVEILQNARGANGRKARLLLWAMGLEVAAVAIVGAAVVVVLIAD
ncbi:MAG TPA: hypothetical protein VGS09_00135 [Actinomycetota bacterium]|nr:hypothetical protein [Actinomycetota bacterium]